MSAYANDLKIVAVFRGFTWPEDEMILAGYSTLINYYELKVPLPHSVSAINQKHQRYEERDDGRSSE